MEEDGVERDQQIVNSINTTKFKKYHDEILYTKSAIIQISDDMWIVPKYNPKKKELWKNHFFHVTKMQGGWSCTCNEEDYLTMQCEHQSLIQLIETEGNPTGLTVTIHENFEFEGIYYYTLAVSDDTRSEIIWSVYDPSAGAAAIVNINRITMSLTCDQHASARYCPHVIGLNKYIIEMTQGVIDIRAIFKEKKEKDALKRKIVDEATGLINEDNLEAAMNKKKDLSKLSQKRVPVPKWLSIASDYQSKEITADEINKYYETIPLLHRSHYPFKLQYVP